MRILVIGSGGRLGAALARELAKSHDCVGLARGDIDLASIDSVDTVLRAQAFEVAVNCAALTNVDYCERNAEEAMLVNAAAPGRMAEICKAKGARLIHVSTDYVLDGEAGGPVTEETPARPLSHYGRSKLEGERQVLDASDQFLVIRVSWVFGPDRPSFVDMILNRAIEDDHVEAIADKFSSPTYTLDFADCLARLLATDEARGVLHLCNAGGASWREYGERALRAAAAAGAPLRTTTVHPIHLADMRNFVARRPVNTVLSTDRYTRLTGHTPRPWGDAVDAYVRDHAAPRLRADTP